MGLLTMAAVSLASPSFLDLVRRCYVRRPGAGTWRRPANSVNRVVISSAVSVIASLGSGEHQNIERKSWNRLFAVQCVPLADTPQAAALTLRALSASVYTPVSPAPPQIWASPARPWGPDATHSNPSQGSISGARRTQHATTPARFGVGGVGAWWRSCCAPGW
ncbi:hypothetical protein K438DRAFT_1988582 [Mycena galopus ATCC 62051]|nr:hypothetical protein K438DRAFT_1988582 [Mycena galopus ATCC 62051]